MSDTQSVATAVNRILASVLGRDAGSAAFEQSTPILGAIPEFDSMAVVTVLTAVEEEYGIFIEDDEVDASIFETFGALTAFVEQKIAQ